MKSRLYNWAMDDKKEVRVRIAPSPTGFAHVGTLWMALFNYAFAKNEGGSLILRLDDTDIDREVKGAESAIVENLTWAGLSWDEGFDVGGKYGPYRQSEKLEMYRSRASELIEKGLAYEDDGAIRVSKASKAYFWNDLIRGKVEFPATELEKDFVILKSNGYPTYHFATVVDEIDMKVSHVIRGDEHISNTPRQLYFYELLGVDAPRFAHIPTIRNKEGKKLSKRKDPVDIGKYREEGYLPEALINYLCLIGWSHPRGKDIFPLNEFVDNFSLERVQKSEPKLDISKLDWINKQYVQGISNGRYLSNVKKVSKYSKVSEFDEIVKNTEEYVKPRIGKFLEFDDMAGFYFKPQDIDKASFTGDEKEHLKVANEVLKDLGKWDLETLNDTLLKALKENDFKVGKFFQDLRVAITGKKVSPPINESMIILGKDESMARIRKVIM